MRTSCLATVWGLLLVLACVLAAPGKFWRRKKTTTVKPKTGCVVDGVQYAVGQSFMIDCNTCSCTENGLTICTKIYCGPFSPGCSVNGVHYEVGETFQDDCNSCSCTTSGFPICTLRACLTTDTVPSTTTGKPGGCVVNGVRYDEGQTYQQDCNTCSCMARGVSFCTLRACLPQVTQA